MSVPILNERYHLQRILDRGGMGEVYVARQLAIDRTVAVKLMRPDRRSDARSYRRFIEEARSLSAIQHPNVVTVHDFGQTPEGLLFLVMELVEGRALSAMLGEERLSVAQAVDLALQICSGLRASHQAGIVHGDLKPSNVLVSQREGIGELVKLLDFGLARLTSAAVEGGRVQGTPRYMSPEQSAGRALDTRSDIYSFGVMLYEMLAGQPPFTGTLPELIAQHRDTGPPPLGEVPPGLSQLVMACLAKSPAERPQSVKILQEALGALRDDLSAEPRPRSEAAAAASDTGTLSQSIAAASASLRSDDRVAGPDGEVWFVRRVVEDFAGRTVIEGGPEGAACRRLKVVRIPDERADWELEQQLARWLPASDGEDALAALRSAQIRGRALLLWGDPLPGVALSDRLYREDRFSLDEALALVESVARALATMHRDGLLHLDLRPRHIRLLPDDAVVLADPGLWPLVGLGLRLYPMEEIQQARRDKPPEQLRGDPLGVEVDLYAVGTLLLRLLRGSISDLTPLSALIERLRQPDPLQRYRSADDLADDLAALRRGEAPQQGGAFGWLDAPGRLHGRAGVLAMFDTRLAALAAGRGGVVELSGPAGSGRSRLLDEAARRARRQGAVVLAAAPRPGDRDIPYSVLRSLLSGLARALSALPDEDRLAVMGALREEGAPLGALLHGFAPLLRELLADARQPPEIPVHLARERQLRALQVLFSVLSRAPCQLCIVLDDVQWLDPASAAWLERQRTTLEVAPALLILATPEAPAATPDRVVLGGLDTDSVAALLAERLGAVDAAVVAASSALTGGLPGALLALLREGEEQGVLRRSREGWSVDPEQLLRMAPTRDARRRIDTHLDALPAPVRSVLEVVAIWSTPLPVPLLEALCGGPVLPALSHAGCSTLIGLSAEGWGFPHEAIRAALLAGLDAERRRQLHRRAAEHLIADDATAQRLLRIGVHLLRAGPTPADLPWLRRSADAAVEQLEGQLAVSLSRSACSVLPPEAPDRLRLELSALLARALLLSEEHDEAAALYAEGLLHDGADPELRVVFHSELAALRARSGDIDGAIAQLESGLSELGWRSRSRAAQAAVAAWGVVSELLLPRRSVRGSVRILGMYRCQMMGRRCSLLLLTAPTAAVAGAIELLVTARRVGSTGDYCSTLSVLGLLLARVLGAVRPASRLIARSAADADDISEFHQIICQLSVLFLALCQGRLEPVDSLLRQLRGGVERVSNPLLKVQIESMQVMLALARGRPDTAIEAPLRLRSFDQSDQSWGRLLAAIIALECGRSTPALAMLAAAPDETMPAMLHRMHALLTAWARLLQGEATAAARIVSQIGQVTAWVSTAYVQIADQLSWMLLTDAFPEAEQAAARSLLPVLLRRGRRAARSYPMPRLIRSLARARSAMLAGRPERARQILRRQRALATTLCGQGAIIGAEHLATAASLEGGRASPEGRQLIALAQPLLETSHPCMQIHARLGHAAPPPDAFEAMWAPLRAVLSAPT